MDHRLENLLRRFPDWDPAIPADWRAATVDEVRALERRFDVTLPPSFVEFQTDSGRRVPMGARAWDGFGFVTPDSQVHQRLAEVLVSARSVGVKPFLIPFHYEEGVYWCFDSRHRRADGECPVILWDHMETQQPDGIITGGHARYGDFIDWLVGTFDD